MAESDAPVNDEANLADGPSSLEAKLRRLFADQHRLREELEQIREKSAAANGEGLRSQEEQNRAELRAVNREVLRTQDSYCTNEQREEEYRRCIIKLTGFDPYVSAQDIEEWMRTGVSMQQIIEEIEKEAGLSSGGAQHG